MPDFAKLKVDNKGLHIIGEGPIDSVITIKVAEAILSLPASGSLTPMSVLKRLTDRTRRSFESIVRLDKQLAAKFATLKVKHTIDREDVIEELVLGLVPIGVIIFTTNGERFVAKHARSCDDLLTFDEFEAKYGRSVLEWVRHDANVMIETFQRAVALLEGEPVEYTLDVVTKDMAADTKKITVYSEEQIHLFAKRHNVSIMNTSKKD